ncbi:MAG: XylR family transcriptional regulator [Kiritimatiellae bacterium]|nr:XylR family transcriptional regulator [Kiritimatiellia bacterium]MDD5523243.1 XylR family transcriptional regulator [Kiritimatiellia bacterium]
MKRKLKIPRILLLIETSRVYGRHLVEGIGRYAHEHGPWSFHFEERGVHELSVRALSKLKVDGVISRIRDPGAARKLQATGLPFVELHGNPKTCKTHVTVDEYAIARMAAEHLIDRGLKNLGFFSRRNEWWLQIRRNAFVDYLKRFGYPCATYSASAQSQKKNDESSQQSDLINWLQSLPRPVGIFCATDMEALTLLEACRHAGIAVPDQIAVLGVDNDSVICSVAWPRLSSIDLDAQRVGYESAALLARIMADGTKPNTTILVPPSQVVVRESTDVLAIADAQVVQAARLIRQFACKGIDVSHVADHILMCRRTLERRFKACLGRTLKEEILRVKMDQAKILLSQSDYPIKRISDMSGFKSLHYFARAFRRETGSTPGRYRQRTR